MSDARHIQVEDCEDLGDEQVVLERARVAFARKRDERAAALLEGLRSSSQPEVEVRVRILLARLHHRRVERERAFDLLADASERVRAQRAERRHRESGNAVDAGASTRFDPETRSHGEVQLELARAWSLLGHRAEAKTAYADLLSEPWVGASFDPEARSIAALAEYRVAELLVDEAPADAYEHWRRAFDSGDEQISRQAALCLATRLGGELVAARVERLFRHAMGSSDPRVFCEAALGLAEHLIARRRFDQARECLTAIAARKSDVAHAEEAAARLKDLSRTEDMVRIREEVARPRALQEMVQAEFARDARDVRRVIVVGADADGYSLLESLDEDRYAICGFVDDDARDAPGAPRYEILGRIDELPELIDRHEPHEVLLAVTTLAGSRRRAVVEACRDTATPLLGLPRIHELGIGWTLKESRRRLMAQLRPVEVEEIIGDRRVEVDAGATAWLQYRTAVVIGAGALGAEICRRLADGDVGRLVVIDRRPSALRKIGGELTDSREFRSVEALVGDASDLGWLAAAFRDRAPSVVFNTTAHTSAPPLEGRSPIHTPDGGWSVVRNEILVAAAVASAAAEARVRRTIHVSSRWAGASGAPFDAMKALGEEIVLWHALKHPRSVYSVIRVGQLLDSRNGRLARLKQQVETGSKVTIPRPGTSVRFLSTARWAELVLHGARLASNGSVLEPDAGEKIGIRDIAEEAIRLRGWSPEEHIPIEEGPNERWSDPVPPEPRRQLEPAPLGIFALSRPPASDESLRDAFKTCAALVGEHQNSPVGDADSMVGDVFGELAEAWLKPSR